jgi:hypothetical protein
MQSPGPGTARGAALTTFTPAAPAVSGARAGGERPRRRGRRGFYVGMGVVAVLVVIAGFHPAIRGEAGGTRALPTLVRLHGFLFTAWLALFIAQARLVATGRVAVHRRLGLAAAVLAPAMVAVGVVTTIRGARRGWPFDGDPLGFMVHPLGDLLAFSLLVGAALWFRRRPEVHKRLLLLATVGPMMNAPITHINEQLPAAVRATPLFLVPMALLLFAGAVHDRITRGRFHPVTLWGAVILFAFGNVREVAIRPSTTWHRVAAALVR